MVFPSRRDTRCDLEEKPKHFDCFGLRTRLWIKGFDARMKLIKKSWLGNSDGDGEINFERSE